MIKTILLDTNSLMAIAQFKLDLFSQLEKACDFPYQLRILDKTIEELKKIILNQTGKNQQAAKLALEIIKKKKIETIQTKEGKVDDLLVELAQKPQTYVLTQDKELKKRIKAVKGRVITIRQKKRLFND